MLVHVPAVVESGLNHCKEPFDVLCRTRLSFKRRGIGNQVMVAVKEDTLVVTKIIKAVGIMN